MLLCNCKEKIKLEKMPVLKYETKKLSKIPDPHGSVFIFPSGSGSRRGKFWGKTEKGKENVRKL